MIKMMYQIRTNRSALYVTFCLLLFVGSTILSVVTGSASNKSSATGFLLRGSTDNVMRLSMVTSDIIYNPLDRMIYVSRPSTAGPNGNSISRIDPLTGEVISSVYVGSEPNKMAISDDGQTLYVTLDGAYAIRRFETASQTPGLQFSIGRGQSVNAVDAPFLASAIAVVPGDPNSLAVSRYLPGISPPGTGVAIFNNGVRLPNTGPGHSESSNYVAFSDSPSRLYGGGFYQLGLRTLTVDENGVTDITSSGTPYEVRNLKFESELLFDSLGHVIDPKTRELLGTCPGANGESAFVPNVANRRVLYAAKVPSSENVIIRACDIDSFTEVNSLVIPDVGYDLSVTSLVRYGTNGLAMRTSNDQIYLIQTSLIPTSDPLPTPSGTPIATPTPTPPVVASFIRSVTLPNNDLIYRNTEQKFYVSVPSAAGPPRGDSITRVDPATAIIEDSVEVGIEPGRMALSDDGNTMYVGLNGPHSVRRVAMHTVTPGLEFPLGQGTNGPKDAYDIDVLPGDPNAVAISYGNSSYSYDGSDIFDNGIKRPQHAQSAGSILIASPDTAYIGEYYVSKYGIAESGFSLQQSFSTTSGGESELVGDLLYTSEGAVVDLNTLGFTGSFTGVGFRPGLTVDVPNNRIYFLANRSAGTPFWEILAYRLDNFLPIGGIPLPGVALSVPYPESPHRLIRWGTNGLAFHDNNDKIYFIQTDLVSADGKIPSAIQLSSDTFSGTEGSDDLQISVVRTGGLTNPSTINYATSDLTAIAGADYVAASGTIIFEPGESVKTINVPLINDNVYEPTPETFSLHLSEPGGIGTVELREPSSATLTIFDDDSLPTSTSANVTVNEPRISGTTTALFTIQLSNPTSQIATIDYATIDGTATAGSDYIATSGRLTFAPMETVKNVAVTILADQIYNEPNETFRVSFTNGQNVGVLTFLATGTIIDYNPQVVPHIGFDYDGDGRSDISVFRPGAGDWYLQRSVEGFTGVNFGIAEDRIVPADFDGDGKTDVAVYRPSTGNWYVLNSSNGNVSYYNFGVAEDLPAPADYDGDGKADICVFRPSTGTWYRLNSGNGEFVVVQFGAEGDKLTVGDFDGDGKSDIAIFRPSEGAWYQTNSSDGMFFGEQFGISTDRVTPADYDGDGKTDIAIYRPADGLWYVKNSATSTYTPYLFGIAEDIPVPGDYDGDGKADIGVFRPLNGTWYIANSSNGGYTIEQFGQSADRPTQSAFGSSGSE